MQKGTKHLKFLAFFRKPLTLSAGCVMNERKSGLQDQTTIKDRGAIPKSIPCIKALGGGGRKAVLPKRSFLPKGDFRWDIAKYVMYCH